MNINLKTFVWHYARVVLATAMVVITVAFVSVPLSLGGHPGEARNVATLADRHAT